MCVCVDVSVCMMQRKTLTAYGGLGLFKSLCVACMYCIVCVCVCVHVRKKSSSNTGMFRQRAAFSPK